jgi:uncharacterized protein (TIGR03067 family)
MRCVLCLTMLATVGFAPAPVYKPKASEKDLDLLQGKWVMVGSRDEAEPAQRDEQGVCLVVRGSVLEVHHNQGSPDRYRLVIDGTKKERTLELHGGAADSVEKPYRGLYRLRGDELTISIGSTRGEGATSIDGGRGMEVAIYKRTPKP